MVSIIIPALNEEESIPFLLENLSSQEGNFEIIVADGGSADNTCPFKPNQGVSF